MEPHWVIDEGELKSRFLTLSAQVHPDRFVNSPSRDAMYALRWTTAVNNAFRTLRDPNERTRYFLRLHGVETERARSAPPTDLAETYFELMDRASDHSAKFKVELQEELARCRRTWSGLVREWPSSPRESDGNATINKLYENWVREQYICSMLENLEKREEGGR